MKTPQKYLRRGVCYAPDRKEERQQRQWRVYRTSGWSKTGGDALNMTARPPGLYQKSRSD